MNIGSRLLVVDDDEVFGQVLGGALEARGFQVEVAEDTEAAIEHVGVERPGYAVIDLCIGEESGLLLAERLLAIHQDLQILILTGYASVATAVAAIKLGAIHYLSKPAGVDEILAALSQQSVVPKLHPERRPVSLKRLEWEHVQKVLQAHDGNISAAARAMNMHRRTLQRKLQKRPVTH